MSPRRCLIFNWLLDSPPYEESLLYGGSEQPLVQYPRVRLPNSQSAATSIDSQLHVPPPPKRPGPVANVLQAAGIRRAKTLRRLQVGLDFGTSTTKVMYRELGIAESRVRLLSFNHGLSDYPAYCLPSVVTFDNRGNLLLGEEAEKRIADLGWGGGLSRLKMLVAGRIEDRYLDRPWYDRFREHVKLAVGDDQSYTPDALAAVYLAALMRRTRRQLQREFGAYDLDLIFNTCVPVDQSERTPLVRQFERVIATAAELESELDGGLMPREWADRAMERLPEIGYDIADDAQRVFLMPEAVATAAGYVTSVRRRPGIHAVVDIGAGTTDVSICLLTLARKAGATIYWYAARSIPMGAARIEGMVASALARTRSNVPLELVHRALRNDPALCAECGRIVYEELMRIWNGTGGAWAEAYCHDERQSAWTGNAVTVFLTGGGAVIPAARSIFSASWQSNWGPYPCSIIPTPESFDNRSAAPFHRLSVAFGLSTPLPELGYHVMPSKSPIHTPAKGQIRQWQQEGDQLLPRWGWT